MPICTLMTIGIQAATSTALLAGIRESNNFVYLEWLQSDPFSSLFKFRPLLPDETPEVTYEPATYLVSTMVEFQIRI